MTNTDITPEILRAVAEWTEHRTSIGSYTISRVLRKEAASLERDQADENRIDELARIFWDASVKDSGFEPAWESVAADAKPYYRAGIRAVLDKLRIDSYTSPCDGKCGDSSPHNGHLTTEGRRHFLGEPRTWNDLRHVPGDVQKVRDVDGHAVHRVGATGLGWRWQGAESAPTEEAATVYAPFTEVIADA